MAEAIAVLGRLGARGKLRPQPQVQFKLLPVPSPAPVMADWNDRVAQWAAS